MWAEEGRVPDWKELHVLEHSTIRGEALCTYTVLATTESCVWILPFTSSLLALLYCLHLGT